MVLFNYQVLIIVFSVSFKCFQAKAKPFKSSFYYSWWKRVSWKILSFQGSFFQLTVFFQKTRSIRQPNVQLVVSVAAVALSLGELTNPILNPKGVASANNETALHEAEKTSVKLLIEVYISSCHFAWDSSSSYYSSSSSGLSCLFIWKSRKFLNFLKSLLTLIDFLIVW